MKLVVSCLVLLGAMAAPAAAGEGKWTPEQVLRLEPAWLRQQGLELSPKQLWDPAKGTGLLAAAVNLGGCSAAFVSRTGLIATNHHCLFSILQEHSTTANDIITNGFLAKTPADELSSKTTRVTIPRSFTDVTREVRAAIPQGADDLARQRAIESKGKAMVAACEQQRFHRCRVASFDGGLQYVLVDTLELPDVRLVYAPPRSIGEYGGEIDNWAWPRHTGDFAIARAYVGPDGNPAAFSPANVPYKPEFIFPMSRRGASEGEFVMVMGYPGVTYRSLTALEMAQRRDLHFRTREDLYGEWIRLMEKATEGRPEGAIAVAGTLKSMSNVYKNAQGQLAGFARGRIVEKQQATEAEVVTWAKSRPEFRPALDALQGLNELARESARTAERDFLLGTTSAGSRALYLATTLVRAAKERQKPDADREPAYMDRERPRLRDRLEREQKSYDQRADRTLFASFLARASKLTGDQRLAAAEGMAERLDAVYSQTKVMDLAERLAMFEESPEQLQARKDPLLEFAFQLDGELLKMKERADRWAGTVARLRPEWLKAVQAHAGKPVAPDANGTLRVSFARVSGYSPRDGVFYRPQTTLAGVIEKHTGEEPFDVPPAIREAFAAKRFGPWRDAKLGDVPVNFLADADTTGGNSGSPVVNGKGELVGLNFDRVWENVANDFGYNPAIARNISVDIRYALWLLDQVTGARALLDELGVR